MVELKIQIVSYTHDHNPGWVKWSFTDIFGNVHFFEEKVPVVTTEYLDANSSYPQTGSIKCQAIHKNKNAVTIDISHPLGIETGSGKTIFEVFEDQIISN